MGVVCIQVTRTSIKVIEYGFYSFSVFFFEAPRLTGLNSSCTVTLKDCIVLALMTLTSCCSFSGIFYRIEWLIEIARIFFSVGEGGVVEKLHHKIPAMR